LQHSEARPQKAITLTTRSEEETTRLGQDIACVLQRGDMVLLKGDLGVGKSVLARACIRTLARDKAMDVPSPTYTLCQTYDGDPPAAHFDLYRLSNSSEMEELGLSDAVETGVVFVEWPERVFQAPPPNAIEITIQDEGEDIRLVSMSGNTQMLARIKRSLDIRDFLADSIAASYGRTPMTGDASTRRYELLEQGERHRLLLMDAPATPDGPAVKDGKPYSRMVHLAEDVSAFVAVDQALAVRDFSVPRIFKNDLSRGLLLTSHLGSQGVLDGHGNPIKDRYREAIAFLNKLHGQTFEADLPVKENRTHRLHSYNGQIMGYETELFLDWYLPAFSTKDLNVTIGEEFAGHWKQLTDRLADSEQTLVLRDFHSPNILWMRERFGIARVGVIDFQDALLGPTAYDVASLAQDARVDINPGLESELVEHYCHLRSSQGSDFDRDRFLTDYAIVSAQRATKILGIFVRLQERDGKSNYMHHVPRMRGYLTRSLTHPVLHPYREWLGNVIEL